MHTVSVIVPAYNEEATLPSLLAALERQTYPRELVEIIVIDNNSTDQTAEIARRAGVTVLSETRAANSDVARNTGIAHARGEILAFTDADCRPDPDWLAKLVAAMDSEHPTLAAGRIHLELPDRPTGGQIYDSMSFLNHENSVRYRKIAFTANLAVPRDVALAVGGVPVQSVNAGDSYFARLCYLHGCRMVYVPEAVVRHPSRSLSELLRKTRRIASGYVRGGGFKDDPAKRDGYRRGLQGLFIMPHLRALFPWFIYQHLRSYGLAGRPVSLLRTWCAAVLVLGWGVWISGITHASNKSFARDRALAGH